MRLLFCPSQHHTFRATRKLSRAACLPAIIVCHDDIQHTETLPMTTNMFHMREIVERSTARCGQLMSVGPEDYMYAVPETPIFK
jgi:hypothetical protein